MELPDDLMVKILARLPLKDVLSYRCVCREWYMLISNPNFSSYYEKNSPFTNIFLTHVCSNKLVSLSLLQFAANGEFIQIPIKPKIPKVVDINSDPRVTIIVDSYDGSLFLLHRIRYRHCEINKVYFCNPLLGGCVKIAENRVVNSPWCDLGYKVGYIPSTNNYKLLRFFYDGKKLQVKIFTVGVDKDWRIVEDPFTFWEPWSEEVFFNGASHWLADNENLDKICTFDLLEEKCSGIPKPPVLLPFSWKTVDLAILNDRLSLVDYSDCFQMNIWTMDNYGVAESWFRNIILLKHWFPSPKNLDLENFLPIAVLPNGNIIFSETDSGSLYFFSLEEKQCSRIKLRGVGKRVIIMTADAFVPRFYSVKGMKVEDSN